MNKYKFWIEKGKKPVDPNVTKLLEPVILELAIVEDVTGPSCYQLDSDKYVAQCAKRFRESIVDVLQKAAITVADTELDEICRGVAGEVFVIRGLNEARLNGEISLDDIKQVDLYERYRGYFERSPGVEAKAREVVALYAETLRKKAKGN